jgi:hypothetical protein
MPGGELEPIGRSGPALAEVAAEMSEIFAEVGVSQPVAGLRRPAPVAALRPSRGNGPTLTVLVAVAAGLLGLGAGAFVIRAPGPQAPSAEAKVAAQAASPPQARPQPRPAASATAPIALAQAAPAPTAGTAPAKAIPAATASHSPAKAAERARAKFRMKLARLGKTRPAEAKPPLRLPIPVAQPADCEQDSDGDGCREALVRADRHLRAVYENAIRRGVSRDVLVDYRDRWADLRDRQTDNPARLIESYGALAYDLGRETADDQEDTPRPRGRSGLKALADLLLPWR